MHCNDVRYIHSKVLAEVNIELQPQVLERAYSPVKNFLLERLYSKEQKPKLSRKADRHPSRWRACQWSFPTELQAFVGGRETIT